MHLVFLVNFGFATEPTNKTVLQGTNTFLSCEVDGTEIINITWVSQNGLTITSDFSHITIVTSSSSTRWSSTLRFANVQMLQSEGWYTCICHSYNGSTNNIVSLRGGAYLYVQGMYISAYLRMCTHMYVRTYVHAYNTIYMHMYAFKPLFVSMYVCTYLFAHIHAYIHTYIPTYSL